MQQTSWRGPAAMTAAMALFSANDALVKLSGSSLPPSQSIAIRGIIATLATLGVIVLAGRARRMAGATNAIVLLRALCECFGIFCLITALTRAPLGDVTAVSQMAPLFVLPLAALLYRERVSPIQWLLVAAGFAGVLMIARPGGGFDPAILLALGTAAGFACRDLLAARIPKQIPPDAVTMATLVVVAAAGFAWTVGRGAAPVGAWQVAGLGAAGLLLSAGQALIYMAFRWAPVSDVAPFNYTKTVFGLIGGVIVFGDLPGPLSLAGAGLVMLSGVGVALAAAKRAR